VVLNHVMIPNSIHRFDTAVEAPALNIENLLLLRSFKHLSKAGIHGSTEEESKPTEKKVNNAQPGPQGPQACARQSGETDCR
jgi:hypothetical protein